MRIQRPIAAMLVFTVLATASGADPLGDSTPLVCVPAAVADCDDTSACAVATLEDVGLPKAWRVDFAAKQLAALGSDRTSPLQLALVGEQVMVLQGGQNGRGWSVVIDRASGRMSGAVAAADGAVVLSGHCKAE